MLVVLAPVGLIPPEVLDWYGPVDMMPDATLLRGTGELGAVRAPLPLESDSMTLLPVEILGVRGEEVVMPLAKRSWAFRGVAVKWDE